MTTTCKIRLAAQWLALSLFTLLSTPVPAGGTPAWLPELLEKDSIRIVVTDSGLGGLSVVADAAGKFRQSRSFEKVDLVFANALFTSEAGYNALQTREEKLAVFSSALEGMRRRYDPDVILVACNTLSVLIPDTEFARDGRVPVVGIVAAGVEQIAAQLAQAPGSRNIIFATQGTVDEGTHGRLLQEMGIAAGQIVPQACPQLTEYIEQGFDSMYTEMLIDAYVDEALSKAGETAGPLSVSFNCTHFGYSLEAWKKAFDARGVEVAAFLDPNRQMVDFLLPQDHHGRFATTGVSVRVASMVDIPAGRRESIGRYLQTVSPATAAALDEFELVPDLFEWRKLTDFPAK